MMAVIFLLISKSTHWIYLPTHNPPCLVSRPSMTYRTFWVYSSQWRAVLANVRTGFQGSWIRGFDDRGHQRNLILITGSAGWHLYFDLLVAVALTTEILFYRSKQFMVLRYIPVHRLDDVFSIYGMRWCLLVIVGLTIKELLCFYRGGFASTPNGWLCRNASQGDLFWGNGTQLRNRNVDDSGGPHRCHHLHPQVCFLTYHYSLETFAVESLTLPWVKCMTRDCD